MYRRDLAADAGMLFLYERAGMHSMWMRNTLIPLDMLFITRDGRIVHIAQRTVPGSLDAISSEGPVKAVLEVNGGTAEITSGAASSSIPRSTWHELSTINVILPARPRCVARDGQFATAN